MPNQPTLDCLYSRNTSLITVSYSTYVQCDCKISKKDVSNRQHETKTANVFFCTSIAID